MIQSGNDDKTVDKDESYSPASGRESEVLQDSPVDASAAVDDVPEGAVKVLPGTGSPDDYGDLDPDEAAQAAKEFDEHKPVP